MTPKLLAFLFLKLGSDKESIKVDLIAPVSNKKGTLFLSKETSTKGNLSIKLMSKQSYLFSTFSLANCRTAVHEINNRKLNKRVALCIITFFKF